MSGSGARRTAVVVVTFDPPDGVLERCLDSVAGAGGADAVIVVDNGGAVTWLDDTGVGVEVIRPDANRGFGAGANRGIERARARGADHVAVLNDDVEVEPGWLGPLCAVLDDDPRVGAVQPKLLLAGTDPVRVNSVGVEIGPDGAGRDVGYGMVDGAEFDRRRDVTACTGGAVVFRSTFLDELGGFDERYFLYYEDVDLGLRGAERGWRAVCEPASRAWHSPGTSTLRVPERVATLQERNRLWVAARFGSPSTFARAVWLSLRRLRHRPRLAHARGLVGGLAGAPRRLAERRRARRERRDTPG